MPSKNIYFLINSLWMGGAENVVVNLSNGLAAEWYCPTIITFFAGVHQKLDPRVTHLPLINYVSNQWRHIIPAYFFLWIRLVVHFASHQYEGGISFLEPANILHILSKRHAIVSFRTSFAHFKWTLWSWYLRFVLWLYQHAKRIIVNSEENRHLVIQGWWYDPEIVVVLKNTIDLDQIALLKQESLPDNIQIQLDDKKVFVTVARLITSKHHDHILRGLAQWHQKTKEPFTYLIVGDGTIMYALQQLASDLNISQQVVFVGSVTNVFPYLYASDCFLFASEYEWFPNVLLEALAVGLPIITTDFSTWAREVMLGEYDPIPIDYPYPTPYWCLLSHTQYSDQLSECLDTYTDHIEFQEADVYNTQTILTQFKILIDIL